MDEAMDLPFVKMHGLGNDFVVLDALARPITLSPEQIRLLADRRLGVGCDQVLLIAPPRSSEADIHYRIFNADGGEVEQCGNGARCVASYLYEHALVGRGEIRAETSNGLISMQREGDGQIRVNMGVPRFKPEQVPIAAERMEDFYQVELDGQAIRFAALSMGNPHAVLTVDDCATAPVTSLGPRLEQHPVFPQRANIGFMQLYDFNRILLRVWERGVGETRACGTGACAAVVAGQRQGLLGDTVDVSLPGGQLRIHWAGDDTPVWMSGPAVSVFKGEITL
jgi:diaminopimelate epimerase